MSETGMEQKYIQEAFDTQWVAPLGPNVDAFEKNLEDFVNCHLEQTSSPCHLDHPTCHLDQAKRVERSLDHPTCHFERSREISEISPCASLSRDDKGNMVCRDDKVYDSNYWLTTITLDPALKVKGQENAYKQMVTGAVGGAAGVIHTASTPVTDCQPNDNVEAMRLALLAAGIESRPLWKPLHKQPVYRQAPAYVNGVSEGLFKVGMCLPTGPCVSDEDVEYIVNTIKDNIL